VLQNYASDDAPKIPGSVENAEVIRYLDHFREQLVQIEIQIKEINTQKSNHLNKFLNATHQKLLF